MKNLKKIIFGLLAMLVMVTGVKAVTYTGCKEATSDGNALTGDVCTIETDQTLNVQNITKDLTINTEGHVLTINQSLTINEGVKLTIKGGNVLLNGATVTVSRNSSLIITGTESKVNALTFDTAASTVNVNHGTLVVSDNNGSAGIVVRAGGKDSVINLTDATMEVNNNKGNGMNAAGFAKIVAEGSKITANGNSSTGISADFDLKYDSTVVAEKNGYSGVVLGDSSIDETSSIVAQNNLTANDDIATQKADILLQGDVTVKNGKLTGGSVAPLKVTWDAEGKGTIDENINLKVSGTNVSFTELKGVCDGVGSTKCSDPVDISSKIAAEDGEYAVVTVGEDSYLYTAEDYKEDIKLDETVKNLIVTEKSSFGNLTVVGGTKVTNETEKDILVLIEGTDNAVKVPGKEKDKEPSTVVVGTAKEPENQPENNPENNGDDGSTTPTEPDNENNQTPSDETTNNPNTLDSIVSIVTLAISSIGTAGYSIKKIIRK